MSLFLPINDPPEVPAQLYWGTRLLPGQNNLGKCNPEVTPTIRQSLGLTLRPRALVPPGCLLYA